VIEHGVNRGSRLIAPMTARGWWTSTTARKAPAEADAAEICENDQNNHSHEKANDHLVDLNSCGKFGSCGRFKTLTDAPCADPGFVAAIDHSDLLQWFVRYFIMFGILASTIS